MKFFALIITLIVSTTAFAQEISSTSPEKPLIIGSLYEPTDPNQSIFIQSLLEQNNTLSQVQDSLEHEIEMLVEMKRPVNEIEEVQEVIDACKGIIHTNNRILEGKARIKEVVTNE